MIKMSRLDLLEKAMLISKDSSDPKCSIMRTTLSNYFDKKATINEIKDLLDRNEYHEFIETDLKGKKVYQSIVDLFNDDLTAVRASILASSMITHTLIQMEMNDNLVPKDVRSMDLVRLLQEYFTTGVFDTSELKVIIESLGFKYLE